MRPIPPNQALLTAPEQPTGTTVAPSGVAIPSQAPQLPSGGSSRRLTIYYQSQGVVPAAPVLDDSTDIAPAVIERIVEYASERTQINNIPIATSPVIPVGYGEAQEAAQKRYIDEDISGIPDAETVLNSKPSMFDINMTTPDKLGIHDTGVPTSRIFQINRYVRENINTLEGIGHDDYVNQTLLATRGHNPANLYVAPASGDKNPDNKLRLGSYFYKRPNLGAYATGSYVRSTPDGATMTDYPAMTIEQMKDIGLNIMFEAVQGKAGLDFAIRSSNPSSIAEAEARMIIPSEQRIGKRVSLGRFTPAFQMQKLTGAPPRPENPSFLDNPDDVQSYGNVYNVYAQFDSLVSLGQIALAVAMILAYVALLDLVVLIIKWTNPEDTVENFSDLSSFEQHRLLGTAQLKHTGVYPLGEVDGGDIASQFLGLGGILSPIRHNSEDALNAGIQEFFGFSFVPGTGTGAVQQLASSALKVLTESGRLNVVLREIIRSGISLVEDATVDFSGGASIAGIGNLVKKIRDLKIVKFINVLMAMGDRVRFEYDINTEAKANLEMWTDGHVDSPSTNRSYIDSLPNSRPYYIAKSRLWTEGRGLAWSTNNAGMLEMPLGRSLQGIPANPSSFAGAGYGTDEAGGGTNTHWNSMNMHVSTPAQMNSAGTVHAGNIDQFEKTTLGADRIPQVFVQALEETLEADYMPFYMQDLRTNEILSFHAFLEDASEDFNIEYSAQEGYGRMDKVQIYKGTTRNISVNFKMVATSAEDHDIMWYKLNKLAMMIYPQWTQGRKISVDNIHFIQPFSQIPGATPVIRLRLGDLYKTNFSKMAVARLFGVTTDPDYNVNGQVRRNNSKATSATAPVPNAQASEAQATVAAKASILSETNLHFGASTQRMDARRNNPNGRGHSQSVWSPTDVFSPGDTLVFKPAELALGSGYRMADGEASIPTGRSATGRVIGTYLGTTGTPGHLTGIRVQLVKHVANAATNGINISPPSGESSIVRVNNSAPNTPSPEYSLNFTKLNAALDADLTRDAIIRANPIPLPTGEAEEETAAPTSTTSTAGIDQLNPVNFYDPDKNPIMKAFKSSGGKGLAGVITGFKVDYSEAKGNWGIDGDKFLRAPMYVTVNLTMAVIHDITPGLDAKGIMMAPIWPVGRKSNYFINNGNDTNKPAAGSVASDTENSGQGAVNKHIPAIDYFNPGTKTLYVNRKD